MDSNSPQNEGAIVKEFQERYDNIAYLRTPQRETTHATFNRSIKMSRGKYLTLACADDRHKRDALERMAAVLDARPDVALVYANSHITRGENETFESNTADRVYRWLDWDPLQLLDGCFIGPQPMWRKALHETYGYFDADLESAGDWDLWLRLAEKETFLHVDEMLGLYLYSETSSEHHNPERHQRECMTIRQKAMHREPKLVKLKQRRESRTPADAGVAVLVVKGDGPPDQFESCVASARRASTGGQDLSVKAVRETDAVPENRLNVTVSPRTMTAAEAINEAAAWEAKVIALVSPDVVLTKNWLRDMAAIMESDEAVAAVGPVSNAAPAPQRIDGGYANLKKDLKKFAAGIARDHRREWTEVPYLGGSCLLLDSAAVRRAGGVRSDLPLATALWDLFDRMGREGLKLACARGVFVHHETLTDAEGAAYDDLARVESVVDALIDAGQDAMDRGDYAAAADKFAQLADAVPALGAAHVGLGAARAALGMHAEAVRAFRKAAEVDLDDAEVLTRLGVALFEADEADEAKETLERVLSMDPGHLDAALDLVAICRAGDDYEGGARALHSIAGHHPTDPDVLQTLAILSVEMGGVEGARSALEHIESVAPEHGAVAQLRESLAHAGAA